ncbi:MAG: Ppx/GppA family phosphatase, partial [Sphingomicrobium sp.]
MISTDRVAIVDIGSNSVRLVVYGGPPRVPIPVFNEKVLAGLGSGLDRSGSLKPSARAKALAALKRFKILLKDMQVRRIHVLATAAIRDSDDGPDFVREVERIGFKCDVLSAEDEARLAGEGVISGNPEADGIVGDLGGGSLELVDVANGEVRRGISLPLGVLRIRNSAEDEDSAKKAIRSAIKQAGTTGEGRGRPLYLVGGSWRALAQIDMLATDFSL